MEKITLGKYKGIPVVSQKHARLRHLLSRKDFEQILSEKYCEESYRVLCILIPAIKPGPNQPGIPEYEYAGYISQEAMDNDAYDEENDLGPTTAEIVNAFEVSLMVSGADRVGKVLSLVSTLVNLTPTQTQPSLDSPGPTGD